MSEKDETDTHASHPNHFWVECEGIGHTYLISCNSVSDNVIRPWPNSSEWIVILLWLLLRISSNFFWFQILFFYFHFIASFPSFFNYRMQIERHTGMNKYVYWDDTKIFYIFVGQNEKWGYVKFHTDELWLEKHTHTHTGGEKEREREVPGIQNLIS